MSEKELFSLDIEKIQQKIQENDISICAIGIGRIGLPTALSFAKSGLKTVGLDINEILVNRINSGDFPLKDEPAFEEIFNQVLKIGTFSAAETALQLGWGIQRDRMHYGANLKLITSFLESYSSIAAAIDLAATYEDPEKDFIATAVIRNIGFKMKSYTSTANDTSKLPFEIQLGISQKLEHLPLTLFVSAHNLQRFDIRYDDPNEESGVPHGDDPG